MDRFLKFRRILCTCCYGLQVENYDHKSHSTCKLLPSKGSVKTKKIHKVISQVLDYIHKSQVSMALTSCSLKPEILHYRASVVLKDLLVFQKAK